MSEFPKEGENQEVCKELYLQGETLSIYKGKEKSEVGSLKVHAV